MDENSAKFACWDDCVALPVIRRVAAMLDLDLDQFSPGNVLPYCWHFPLLAGETPRSMLRSDGFPGLGVPLPDFGLPRLLLVGRTVSWPGVLKVGDRVSRISALIGTDEKQTASGRMVLVTLEHKLSQYGSDAAAVVETQTYALLPKISGTTVGKMLLPTMGAASAGVRTRRLIPDETLLFQYSALGFNSHKIHIDRRYAQEVESLPNLVVNGGLSALLAMEFLRTDFKQVPRALRVRHFAPLYCNHPLTLCAKETGANLKVEILNDEGKLAASLEVDI